MSTNSAVIPRWAESWEPVRVSSTQRLAEKGPQKRRAGEAADALGPTPAHPARLVTKTLHLRELRHRLVERPAPIVFGHELARVLVEPVVQRLAEGREIHALSSHARK